MKCTLESWMLNKTQCLYFKNISNTYFHTQWLKGSWGWKSCVTEVSTEHCTVSWAAGPDWPLDCADDCRCECVSSPAASPSPSPRQETPPSWIFPRQTVSFAPENFAWSPQSPAALSAARTWSPPPPASPRPVGSGRPPSRRPRCSPRPLWPRTRWEHSANNASIWLVVFWEQLSCWKEQTHIWYEAISWVTLLKVYLKKLQNVLPFEKWFSSLLWI